MKNVIFTDMLRAQKKKSYIILMGVNALLIVVSLLFSFLLPRFSSMINTTAEAFPKVYSIAVSLSAFFVGIPVYSAIFTDDFKSRTMQTAIGHGTSRTKLVLARFIEVVLVLVEAYICFSIVAFICGMIAGTSVSATLIMIGKMWFGGISIVVNLSLAMMVLYLTMNPTAGLTMYILFAADVFSMILGLLDNIPFLKDNNISISACMPEGVFTKFQNYTFGVETQVDTIQDVVLNNTVPQDAGKAIMYGLILIGVYVVVPIIISQVSFNRKELDF